ncbi:DUF883 domain-containing protein [Niveibacterium sp. SC-1]|uniref:DUF883 family protein n=1 Tax=Niveibacterium sp. SC-1 TaxID=3135646 RepID=UPI00311D7B50
MLQKALNAEPRIDLMADLRLIVNDVERLASDTATVSGELSREARDQLVAKAQAARQRLADTEARLQTQARAAAQNTDDFVHAHPWQAVGTVGAGAFLLGLLIARR